MFGRFFSPPVTCSTLAAFIAIYSLLDKLDEGSLSFAFKFGVPVFSSLVAGLAAYIYTEPEKNTVRTVKSHHRHSNSISSSR